MKTALILCGVAFFSWCIGYWMSFQHWSYFIKKGELPWPLSLLGDDGVDRPTRKTLKEK